jgi:putative endonuclease
MSAPHLLQGRRGERQACAWLMRRGYDVLARRYHGRWGELDIVALEGSELVIVEVKTRASRDFGEPWEFVDWQKQQNLRQAAAEFMARYDLGQYAYRFDIVSVISPANGPPEIRLLRNAF